jgi:hypothetical protein
MRGQAGATYWVATLIPETMAPSTSSRCPSNRASRISYRFKMESECTVSPVLFPRISYDSVV